MTPLVPLVRVTGFGGRGGPCCENSRSTRSSGAVLPGASGTRGFGQPGRSGWSRALDGIDGAGVGTKAHTYTEI